MHCDSYVRIRISPYMTKPGGEENFPVALNADSERVIGQPLDLGSADVSRAWCADPGSDLRGRALGW
jgi:hypothetical protein